MRKIVYICFRRNEYLDIPMINANISRLSHAIKMEIMDIYSEYSFCAYLLSIYFWMEAKSSIETITPFSFVYKSLDGTLKNFCYIIRMSK